MEALQKQRQKNELNDELIEKIDDFLSRQRREVLETVYAHKRISHKELAAGIGSTPTSLWNICQNFRSFQPALLKTEVQGRFKYYELTDLAAAYVEHRRRQEQEQDRRTAAFPAVTERGREDRLALEQGMSALIAADEGGWEMTLENYFVNFLCGSVFSVGPEETAWIERALAAVRSLVFSDDQSGYDAFYEKYLQNPILQNRMEAYMRPFYGLEELKRLLECGEHDAWDVCHMLDVIFGLDGGDGGYEALGLQKAAYGTLRETMLWLKGREAGRDRREVYRDLQDRFSCGNMLSIILADRIAQRA